METLYNIEGAKLTALELSVLAHVAGDQEGVWEIENSEINDIQPQLDHLVLEGFLERDHDGCSWLDIWRIPDECWDVLGPNVNIINQIVSSIGES